MGGVILFTVFSTEEVSKLINLYDRRLANPSVSSVVQMIVPTLVFYIVALFLAMSRKTVKFVPLLAALKCVLFGFASSYLLSTDRGMMEYALWWFPSQLLASILFLLFCLLLSPPSFVLTTNRKGRNSRGLLFIATLSLVVFAIDVILYRLFLL